MSNRSSYSFLSNAQKVIQQRSNPNHNQHHKEQIPVVCYNCSQFGHKGFQCPFPIQPKRCYNCQSTEHLSFQCPLPRQIRCFRCNQFGHRRAQCPNELKRICFRCLESGHSANYCPYQSTKRCHLCKNIGHVKSQCPLMAAFQPQSTQTSMQGHISYPSSGYKSMNQPQNYGYPNANSPASTNSNTIEFVSSQTSVDPHSYSGSFHLDSDISQYVSPVHSPVLSLDTPSLMSENPKFSHYPPTDNGSLRLSDHHRRRSEPPDIESLKPQIFPNFHPESPRIQNRYHSVPNSPSLSNPISSPQSPASSVSSLSSSPILHVSTGNPVTPSGYHISDGQYGAPLVHFNSNVTPQSRSGSTSSKNRLLYQTTSKSRNGSHNSTHYSIHYRQRSHSQCSSSGSQIDSNSRKDFPYAYFPLQNQPQQPFPYNNHISHPSHQGSHPVGQQYSASKPHDSITSHSQNVFHQSVNIAEASPPSPPVNHPSSSPRDYYHSYRVPYPQSNQISAHNSVFSRPIGYSSENSKISETIHNGSPSTLGQFSLIPKFKEPDSHVESSYEYLAASFDEMALFEPSNSLPSHSRHPDETTESSSKTHTEDTSISLDPHRGSSPSSSSRSSIKSRHTRSHSDPANLGQVVQQLLIENVNSNYDNLSSDPHPMDSI